MHGIICTYTLVDFYGKYIIYIYIYIYLCIHIPDKDPMGMVIAVPTGHISRAVCFLPILQKCLGRNQFEESPRGP